MTTKMATGYAQATPVVIVNDSHAAFMRAYQLRAMGVLVQIWENGVIVLDDMNPANVKARTNVWD